MTGEIPPRYGMDSGHRPSRSNIHLLHPSKTDEIEVIESGAINHHNHNNIGNGIADHSRTKVSTKQQHILSKEFPFQKNGLHEAKSKMRDWKQSLGVMFNKV